MKKQAYYLCIVLTVGWFLSALFALSTITGCKKLYMSMGMDELTATTQAAKDAVRLVNFVEQTRDTVWPILSNALAAGGTILSGLLAVLLGRVKKDNGVLKTAIRTTGTEEVKAKAKELAEIKGNARRIGNILDGPG